MFCGREPLFRPFACSSIGHGEGYLRGGFDLWSRGSLSRLVCQLQGKVDRRYWLFEPRPGSHCSGLARKAFRSG